MCKLTKEQLFMANIFQEHETLCREPSVGTWRSVDDKLVCQLVIDPFYSGDDLERECVARRQIEALEEFLYSEHYELWTSSPLCLPEIVTPNTRRQWKINRITWCIEQLAAKDGVMNKQQLEEYEEWRDEVITVACADFGWAYSAIEPIVNGHELQCHFESGRSPYDAVRTYMKGGL